MAVRDTGLKQILSFQTVVMVIFSWQVFISISQVDIKILLDNIKIRHLTFQKYTTVLFQRKHGDVLKKLHPFYLQLYRISMINIIFTFLSSQLDILLPLFRNLMRIDRFSIYQVILKLRAFLEITAFLLISTLTSVRLNLVKKWLYFKEALLILNNRSMLAMLSMEDINGVSENDSVNFNTRILDPSFQSATFLRKWLKW